MVKNLGYYDGDENNRPMRQKGNRGGAFMAGLIGAILGALLILFTVPALSDVGVLPDIQPPQDEEAEVKSEQRAITKDISIDVTNDITSAVANVSEAVVGVINLQKTDFWAEDYGEAGAGSGVIYKKRRRRGICCY